MNQRNEWENLDTSKLTDEELKSEIIRINNTQLSNIRDMAYYYLASRIGEIIDLLENKNLFKEMTFTEEKKTLVKSFNIIIVF